MPIAKKESIHDEALDWEASRIFMIEASERRAWNITLFAIALTLLSWLALVLMMPLKETVPYVIRVNNVTGVPDIVTALHDKQITHDDVMDKYWVATYVRALVDIVSVVPNGNKVATVRFIKHTKRTEEEGEGESHAWVATVAYEYKNPSLMTESKRLINPFGFQVMSYRVDPELVGDKEK